MSGGAVHADDVEFPSTHAANRPDHPAVIDHTTGEVLTYQGLEDRARAVAHRLWCWGLRPGDHVALALSNRVEFFEVCWAAHRLGLYYTAVNTHLTVDEQAAIVADCGARVVFVDDSNRELALRDDHAPAVEHQVAIGTPLPGCDDYADIASARTGPLPHEGEGEKMLYTSGTTGTPKGVARPLTDGRPGSVFLIRPLMLGMGFDASSVLLTPAPLYHSAPLGYAMGVHRLGGTVVITHRFDAVDTLAALVEHHATHGLFVPTMFIRLLRVPDRELYDLTALRGAVHGAAPCPPDIKRAMIEWWGPILYEYYAATEGAGMTLIDSREWLEHPGSVGRSVAGSVHVVDDVGREVPAGVTGTIYFAGTSRFRYHGDDAKTAAAYDDRGWATLGDIGHVDSDGYVYLTDRRSFTVISGGVNIYPQEAENVLAGHPMVADVAAFGVPHPELGEQLIALVVPVSPARVTETELLEWCATRLSKQKLPRRLEFRVTLPRADNGKLYKRGLREQYLAASGSD